MKHVGFALVLTGALASAPAAALADTGLSVFVGPTFVGQSAAQQIGGTVQTNVGAGYDIGPKVIVLRTALQFEYAGGSANGGSLQNYGVGLSERLTTPVYAGAAVMLYGVNAQFSIASPLGGGPGTGSASTTGIGTNIFVGERLLGIPGGSSIGVELRYRAVPSAGGYNPSGVSVGLRAQF